MPAPEKIYLVHPDIAGSPFLPIPAAAVLIAFNGWQLANPDDAQWLTPTPPDPVPEVVTRDELDEAIALLPSTFARITTNTAVTYNAAGLPATETIPTTGGDLVKTYTYDAAGNPLTCAWNFPGATPDQTETFTYDATGRATGSTFA